jgi:hypothetical protein
MHSFGENGKKMVFYKKWASLSIFYIEWKQLTKLEAKKELRVLLPWNSSVHSAADINF